MPIEPIATRNAWGDMFGGGKGFRTGHHHAAHLQTRATGRSLDPRHLEAKRQYRKWYAGYQVVISRVERAYGDGTVSSFVANDRHARHA